MAKNYVVDKKKSNASKKQSFFKRMAKFFSDVKSELKMVSWPTREETVKLTLAVLAFVIVIGAIVGVFDVGITELIKRILGDESGEVLAAFKSLGGI